MRTCYHYAAFVTDIQSEVVGGKEGLLEDPAAKK